MLRVLCALIAVVAAPAHAAVVDRIAAVVNEDVVTLSEVYDLGAPFIEQRCASDETPDCVRQAELEVLDALIRRALVAQELEQLDLSVTGEEVDRAIDQIARENGLEDRDTLRSEVERSGMPWETYRDQITEQLRELKFNENVIRPRISVSENELLDFYKRTARDYAGPEVADLEAMLFQVTPEMDDAARAALIDRARAIAAEVNAGQRDWAKTVAELDQGPYRERAGKMGTFKKGELNERIDSVVFATAEGRVSEPIDVGNAILLVRVVDKRTTDILPFEQVKEQIRGKVYQDKIRDEAEQWYQQARRRAAVRILL